MADDNTEPDDIGSGEIISSLPNERQEIQPTAGDRFEKAIFERRGIRSSIRRVYKDPLENYAQENIVADTAADTYWLMFHAANRHLTAKGLMNFFDVAELADDVADNKGDSAAETTARHFELWARKMALRPENIRSSAAAQFIQAADRLWMFLEGNPEMQEAAHAYADAWHWFHMELFGEHEAAAKTEEFAAQAEQLAAQTSDLAAKTENATRGLQAGPAAKKAQNAIKFSLIARAYADFVANESREDHRKSPKNAAVAILDAVNDLFAQKGFAPTSLGTLRNKMPEIIDDYEMQH